MKIVYDPVKDALNTVKHGVSLGFAAGFEWASAVQWHDTRSAYGEQRQCALGYIGRRLYFMAFVERATQCRVISLRKANLREVSRYAKT